MSFPPEGTKPLFFSWEKGATRVLVAKRKICVKSDIKIKVPEASATTISERLQGGRDAKRIRTPEEDQKSQLCWTFGHYQRLKHEPKMVA